jgi:hypothetical protein
MPTRVNHHILCALLLIAGLTGCASRYALDLFMQHDSQIEKVNVEYTAIHRNQAMGDTQATWKLTDSPNSHVLILEAAWRGETIATREEVTIVFAFDRYVRTRLYYELPTLLTPGRLPAVGHSLVQILGLYDIPERDKLYAPDDGHLVIDSVTSKWLFATIKADFSNHMGDRLQFNGQFRASLQPRESN